MTMGDRITVMKDGDIHQVDAPIELYSRPADRFVAGFIGSPSMNFLPVRVIDHGAILLVDEHTPVSVPEAHQAILERYDGGPVLLGLRPEHIRVSPEDCAFPVRLRPRHDMSELLGNEMYLHLSLGPVSLTGRSSTVNTIDIGSEIDVYVDMAHAHYFDAENDVRLSLHVD
jgi:multiple sugar transport system ATP-binding protein